MDRVIPKKTWNRKRIITLLAVAGIIALVAAAFFFSTGKSRLKVEKDRLSIALVDNGNFQEFITVNGIVMPISTIYLDALEGGRVEEKFVEDGAIMRKGDPILRLSNTDLELSLVNQETSVYNLLTQMQISQNAARQNTITKLNQMTDVESTLREAERLYVLNKKLYDKKAIGLQEYKKSENDYNYQLEKMRLSKQILQQDSISARQELNQAGQSYSRTQNALAVMRKKVDDLVVRAPVDGQLTSLDAEIGQSKNKGERLGQIDVLSGFKIRIEIDEHYISRIYPGQEGSFMFSGKQYQLRIVKVFTQVNNGRFQVDMAFQGPAPEAVRRGQSVQIRLSLSDESVSLLLAKGGFFEQTGGKWVFKLSEDGSKAYRVDVKLGKQNPDYYQVESGLKAGDKVIVSGYGNFGDMQELILQ